MAILRRKKFLNDTDLKNSIISLRQQGDIKNKWMKYRLDNVLPQIMKEEDIDMWIVINRGEYNQDPVIMTLTPSPLLTPMGKMTVFFQNPNGEFEKIFIAGRKLGPYGEFYTAFSSEGSQWETLRQLIDEKNPKKIAINTSEKSQFADGLTHSDFLDLEKALGEEWMAKTVSAYRIAERWLETRTDEELVVYQGIANVIHCIMDDAFSQKVIHPGITTALDVQWWIAQRMLELGVPAWFNPNFQIRRKGYPGIWDLHESNIIMPGDLVWCDVGIKYMGLHTDHQEVGYVLRPGETEAPESLKAALKDANTLQDCMAEAMVAGRTGNEILAAAEELARSKNVHPIIYTHPIGNYGHGAGPGIGSVGMFEYSVPAPIRGDFELHDRTCYAIELSVLKYIPEWDANIKLQAENTAAFVDGQLYFINGRQTDFHLI